MNSEVMKYIEENINEKYNNKDLGFLITNRFKITPGKWIFLDCDVNIVEFNKDHTFAEKVNGEQLVGSTNPERIKNYIDGKTQKGEHIQHQFLWYTRSLKESLSISARDNIKNKTLPNLDKESYTKKELQDVCNTAREINFESYKIANDRATVCARKM